MWTHVLIFQRLPKVSWKSSYKVMWWAYRACCINDTTKTKTKTTENQIQFIDMLLAELTSMWRKKRSTYEIHIWLVIKHARQSVVIIVFTHLQCCTNGFVEINELVFFTKWNLCTVWLMSIPKVWVCTNNSLQNLLTHSNQGQYPVA